VGVIIYLLTAPGLLRTEIVAGSLIVAGGLGNLIDRITRGGRVSDFLNLGIGPVRTGVFNLADLVLMIGAGLWLLVVIREMRAPSEGANST
jgi:signal peptidase II